MKALSIRQPWAWLIANGYKPLENRSWRTSFRGPFLIHAGKSWGKYERQDLEWVREHFPKIVLPERFELGGIVGQAVIVDCIDADEMRWFFGPWGFVIEDAKPLPFVPCRGMLNFFTPVLP